MPRSTITVSIPVPGPRVRWAAFGLATGLLVAVIAGPALTPHSILAADPSTTTPEHTISVSGTGNVLISPDIADLRLGVSITAKTVKDARAGNAKSMTAVIAALKKLGIADRDIQTTILSLQPVYDYSSNSSAPRLTGYQLSNAIAVTIRNLDNVGDAIDGALAAGATTMDGVTFRVENQAAAEAQARHGRDGRGEVQGPDPGQRGRRLARDRRLDQRDGRPDPLPRRTTARWRPPASRMSRRRSSRARTRSRSRWPSSTSSAEARRIAQPAFRSPATRPGTSRGFSCPAEVPRAIDQPGASSSSDAAGSGRPSTLACTNR